MKWIIEYLNGNSISEDEINFQFVDKNNVRFLYFLDQNGDKYGLDFFNLLFFHNHKTYDFKIKGQFELSQFKSANISWGEIVNQNITSWNVGIENDDESYIMSITSNREVYLLAESGSRNKIIRLQ